LYFFILINFVTFALKKNDFARYFSTNSIREASGRKSSWGVTDFMVQRYKQKRQKKLRTARVGGSHMVLSFLLSLLVDFTFSRLLPNSYSVSSFVFWFHRPRSLFSTFGENYTLKTKVVGSTKYLVLYCQLNFLIRITQFLLFLVFICLFSCEIL